MKKEKKVTFASDESLVVEHSPPTKLGLLKVENVNEIVKVYVANCERLACKRILNVINELQSTDGKHLCLNFNNEKLSAKMIDSLEPVLMCPSYSLNFKNSSFIDQNALFTLIDILEYYDACKELKITLSGIIKTQENFNCITRYVHSSMSLSTLDLEGSTFDNGLMNSLCRFLRSCHFLRTLKLQNCSLSGRLTDLLMAIKTNNSLKEFYVGHNHLHPNDVYKFSEVLTVNFHLSVLDLRHNVIKDEGVSYISSGMSNQGYSAHYDGILTLNLSNNAITAVGLGFLSKALLHHTVIESIDLSFNPLSSSGMLQMKESLIGCKHLKSMNLQKTKITDEGTVALAEFIMESKSLQSLDLRSNDIQYAGLMALCLSLRQNRSLVCLEIDPVTKRFYHSNDFSSQIQETLQNMREFLSRNQKTQQSEHEEIIKKPKDNYILIPANNTIVNKFTCSTCSPESRYLNLWSQHVGENDESSDNTVTENTDILPICSSQDNTPQSCTERAPATSCTVVNHDEELKQRCCPSPVTFGDGINEEDDVLDISDNGAPLNNSMCHSVNSSIDEFDVGDNDPLPVDDEMAFRYHTHEMMLGKKCGVAS